MMLYNVILKNSKQLITTLKLNKMTDLIIITCFLYNQTLIVLILTIKTQIKINNAFNSSLSICSNFNYNHYEHNISNYFTSKGGVKHHYFLNFYMSFTYLKKKIQQLYIKI